MNYVYSILLLIPAIIGFIGVALIVVSGFKRIEKLQTNSFLVYHLCFSDSVVFVIQMITQISLLCQGGWSFGRNFIYVNFAMINIGFFSSLMTTLCMTVERYNLIIHGKQFSLKSSVNWMTLSWVFIIVLVVAIILSKGDVIVVQPSGIYSFLSWTSKEHLALIEIFIDLAAMAAPTIFMIVAYIAIWKKYKAVRHSMAKISTNNNYTQKTNSDDTAQVAFDDPTEVIILLKSAIIVGTFLICWTPYMCIVLYQIATSNPCSDLADFIASLLVNINSALNPFTLIFLDMRVRQNMVSSFGFKIWSINDKVTLMLRGRQLNKMEIRGKQSLQQIQ